MKLSSVGMGTQVQSKTYSPGYYSTRDIPEDADSSWSLCYEDTTLSNHLYNGFSLKSLNGYSEYDKEMLKRTMVEHETTFRRQVYDLHRLYRIQKNLMDESHKKVMSADAVQANTIQLNSFSSQMPHLPVASTSYHSTPTTYTDYMNPPFKYFTERSKFPIGAPKDSYKYERMFDLQLPANVYIHSEDTDRKDRCADLNKIYSADPVNDVKLTLGTGEYISGQDHSRFKQNGLPADHLADLNQSLEQFLRPKIHYDVQGNNLSMSSNTNFLSLRSAEGSCSNFPYAAEEKRHDWPFCKTEAGPAAPGTHGLFPFASHLNNTHTAAPPISASAEPVNILQALPIVNVQSRRSNTTVQASWSACDSTQHNDDFRPHQLRHANEASYVNGYHIHFQAGCSSASIAELNLNNRTDIPAFWNDENHGLHKRLKGFQCTNVNFANDTYLNQAHSSRSRDEPISQQDMLFKSQDIPSTSQAENRMQMTEVSETLSCKNFFCFPILEKSHQNATCLLSNQGQSINNDSKGRQKDGLSCTGLFRDTKAPSLEKQIHALINLNSAPEGDLDGPSQITMQNVAEKVVSEIDLEAPIISHSEENVVSLEEYFSPSKMDDEALVRQAAANIVQMSLENGSNFNSITYVSQSPAFDNLQWFVDVVLSNPVHATTSRKGQCWSECSDDGLDYFELMTLNLEEVKMDEYWHRPLEPENQNGEKADASLISTCRKRRQRRDFQKDVLPGLVPLSRNEVNEDLQIIGGMMKASGRPSPTRRTRQKRRNGLHSQASGRLRPRSLALALTEIEVNPPQPQHATPEPELEGRTMIGWGRTTRRCQRQRCTPASIASPLNLKV